MSDTVKEVYVENALELQMFLLKPKIEERYKEISKDLATSNLDHRDMPVADGIHGILNIIILNKCFQWLQNSYECFERDLHAMLQLRRSRFGFQTKIGRANLSGDIVGQKSFEQDKSKTIFSKQEGGR